MIRFLTYILGCTVPSDFWKSSMKKTTWKTQIKITCSFKQMKNNWYFSSETPLFFPRSDSPHIRSNAHTVPDTGRLSPIKSFAPSGLKSKWQRAASPTLSLTKRPASGRKGASIHPSLTGLQLQSFQEPGQLTGTKPQPEARPPPPPKEKEEEEEENTPRRLPDGRPCLPARPRDAAEGARPGLAALPPPGPAAAASPQQPPSPRAAWPLPANGSRRAAGRGGARPPWARAASSGRRPPNRPSPRTRDAAGSLRVAAAAPGLERLTPAPWPRLGEPA